MLLGNGRYELREKLGEGGMGVVWAALDRERAATVALKTLIGAAPESIARFKREFRSLADVVHPNLVALYELQAGNDELFFTMELVRGVPFGAWVRPPPDADTEVGAPLVEDPEDATRRLHKAARSQVSTVKTGSEPTLSIKLRRAPAGELDEGRLRDALRQLAEGVAAIHEAGMLHRDLKPSNVLVGPDGRVVILDFGLVTDLAAELAAGDDRPLEGTVPFMSPEQAARQPLTPASDWYAVGAMIYTALAGRPPFVGARDDVLMDKQVHDPEPPSTHAKKKIAADLEKLCLELLDRRPEKRPGARDVLARLGSRAPARSVISSVAGYDRFVGRAEQLSALERALHDTRHGAAVLVQLSGPSGMGKSRVVRAFLESVTLEDEVLVLSGRCYERESVPFKALDSLIDALARHLTSLSVNDVEGLVPRDAAALIRLFPVLRQVDAFAIAPRRPAGTPGPQELRRRAFAALRDLLVRLADRQPVVLAVDDVQWADTDSAALLASLLRPPDAPALLAVLAYRSEGVAQSEFLRELDEQTREWALDVRRVAVEPLAPAEALALARQLVGDEASLDVDALVREAQGSPLFLEELARRVRGGENPLVNLADAMRDRLARLPAPAARLLAAVAVAGRPLAQEVALRAAEVDDPALLSLLKAGGFLRGRSLAGERVLETYHDRVRETVVAGLDQKALAEHHRRLAVVLESRPNADPETLASYWRGAGDHVRAAELAAEGAARAAAALAFDRAARLYRMALELDPAGQPRTVRTALGDALGHGGRGHEAARAYLAAIPGASASEAIDLEARAASHYLWSGHIDEGLKILEHLLGAVGMKFGESSGATLLSIGWSRLKLRLRGLGFRERGAGDLPASQLIRIDVIFAVAGGLGMVDTLRAADFHWRHLWLALKAGEPVRIARALAAEATFTSLGGVSVAPRSAAILRTVHELANRLDDHGLRGMAAGADGLVAFNEGRWDRALDMTTRAEQIFRDHCTGYRWEIATAQLYTCFVLTLTGRVKEMLARFPTLVEEANERGDLYAAVTLQASMGFYVPLAADDPARGYREIDEAIARWSSHGFHLQHVHALFARASIDLYAGNFEQAVRRFDEAWPDIQRSMLLNVQTMRGLLYTVRGKAALAASRGKDRALLALARKCARKLEKEDVSYCSSQGAYLRGAIALAEGKRQEGLALLEEAEKQTAAAGMALNAAGIRRARGLAIGGVEGAALVASADAYMLGQGLKRPDKIAGIFAPGIAPDGTLPT